MPKILDRKNIRTSAGLLRGVASGLAIAIAAGQPAFAQSADDEGAEQAEEVIVVTGIRGSLSAAADIKRNSDLIVDAITSEDIGKFPDSNVSESLQRISGVSIDRSGGEGQFVTVRGFGPEFNTVLVNGRTIATENAGREFSFDLLAAELISGAEVFKSSGARLQDGGIGSTINIKTARPFDLDPMTVVVTAKGQYEEKTDNIQPQGFGLVSSQWADGTIGALLAVSYQRRKTRTDFVETRGFNVDVDLAPVGLDGAFIPQNYDQIVNSEDRERIGINGTVQFQPSDALLLTLDGLYNKFTVESDARSIGHWFDQGVGGGITSATVDENNTVVGLTRNGFSDFIVRSFNRPTKTRAFGGNLEWTPSDLLTVKFDSSWSRATSNNGGNETFAVIGVANTFTYTNDGNLPTLTGLTNSITDPSLGRAHIAIREGTDVTDRIFENRIDAELETDYDHFKRLRFGMLYSDRNKNNQLVRNNGTLCVFCGYNIDVPDSLLSPFSVGSNFLGGGASGVPTNFLTFDANELFAFLESPAAAAANDLALGLAPGTTAATISANGGFAGQLQPDSFSISEEIVAGYMEADFEGHIGGLPWFVNLGARYVHTSVTSTGSQLTLLDLLSVPGDTTIFNAIFDPTGAQPTSLSNSYDKFLPSFNAKVEFSDTVIGRFSASRTLTRPQVDTLAPRVNFDVVRPNNLLASGGNPNLKPFVADNFDVTLEWYPNRSTAISIAAFYKRVQNFIVSTQADEGFLITDSEDIFGASNTAVFRVRRPRNTENANVRGIELAAQHTFDWLPSPLDGFGFQANATFVGSNASFDPATSSESFALEGLGDSQNAVLFYEKSGFEARVAYNRRERFLQTLVNPVGGDPVFVKTFDQVDLRASYQLTDNFNIFVEGINVTESKNRTTGRFDNQVLRVVDTGARYAFGVRANF